jgi:kelch-like protein 1/4/5
MEDVPEPFKSMNHAERMMKKIEGYASKRQLCDVVIIAGNKRIPGHRLVLSAASDYFAAMFTNDVREAKMEEIVMKDVDPESMEAIVNYAYTGKIWMM